MNFAICDDDHSTHLILNEYIETYCREKQIDYDIKSFFCGKDLLESEEKYNIVFMDIEMPGRSGIEITNEINVKNPSTLVLIITAYRNYIDDAMDASIFRYINKPLEFERICICLDRARERINNSELSVITKENEIVKISKNEIVYFEINKKHVNICTLDKTYIARGKLKDFKKELDPTYFVVPHNSYIVNLLHVKKYERTELTLSTGETILITQRKQREIREKFLEVIRRGQ